MPYWAVARTETQREALAKSCLVQAGFEVLLPQVRTRTRVAPLFANYLFVALGEGGIGWHQVRRTIGVLRMIAFGDRPARVPDREIANLRSRMTDGGLVTLPPPPHLIKRRFAKGERVRIVAGPFAGLGAIHTGMSAHAREVILLQLLGAQRQVAIDHALIAPR
jgi:transcriptional antiterminator RfaH